MINIELTENKITVDSGRELYQLRATENYTLSTKGGIYRVTKGDYLGYVESLDIFTSDEQKVYIPASSQIYGDVKLIGDCVIIGTKLKGNIIINNSTVYNSDLREDVTIIDSKLNQCKLGKTTEVVNSEITQIKSEKILKIKDVILKNKLTNFKLDSDYIINGSLLNSEIPPTLEINRIRKSEIENYICLSLVKNFEEISRYRLDTNNPEFQEVHQKDFDFSIFIESEEFKDLQTITNLDYTSPNEVEIENTKYVVYPTLYGGYADESTKFKEFNGKLDDESIVINSCLIGNLTLEKTTIKDCNAVGNSTIKDSELTNIDYVEKSELNKVIIKNLHAITRTTLEFNEQYTLDIPTESQQAIGSLRNLKISYPNQTEKFIYTKYNAENESLFIYLKPNISETYPKGYFSICNKHSTITEEYIKGSTKTGFQKLTTKGSIDVSSLEIYNILKSQGIEDLDIEELCTNDFDKYKIKFNEKIISESTGRELYPIEAIKSFGEVTEGEIGGYIANPRNLSQLDNSWIDKNSVIDVENLILFRSQLKNTTIETLKKEKTAKIQDSIITDSHLKDITVININKSEITNCKLNEILNIEASRLTNIKSTTYLTAIESELVDMELTTIKAYQKVKDIAYELSAHIAYAKNKALYISLYRTKTNKELCSIAVITGNNNMVLNYVPKAVNLPLERIPSNIKNLITGELNQFKLTYQ